jgi:hypothetical protein
VPRASATTLTAAARELDAAVARGRADALTDLVDIVDDCDRAIETLAAMAAPDQWRLGIEQLRDRALQRFAAAGFECYRPLGEPFDPLHHEAISLDASPGHPGLVTAVHRRGWTHEGQVVIAAAVSVRSAPEGQARDRPELAIEDLNTRPSPAIERRRRRPSPPVFGLCPYGTPACSGSECSLCRLEARG